MSTEQMRDEIIDAYSGEWPLRVLKMSANQVAATYNRLRDKQPQKLKSNKKTIRSSK